MSERLYGSDGAVRSICGARPGWYSTRDASTVRMCGMRVALVTCVTHPNLTKSDSLLADALCQLGHRVVVAPWNGDPGAAGVGRRCGTSFELGLPR